MSLPRVLLVPTHRTGIADAVAAAIAEILGAQRREVRYHHIGPQPPLSAWDRWEGSVFIDPALTGEKAALGLYEVAVRHADISILSSSAGLLDRSEGSDWVPADLARLLDCPVVVLLDCRGWGSGIRILASGLKSHLRSAVLAGVILTGVTDQEHCRVLKQTLAEDGLRVVGCLYAGRGVDWDSRPPGAWGLPLSPDILEAVGTQVDVNGLLGIAGQRGYLATHKRFSDHSTDGPVVLVADGTGFTQWSRDSVEVLRAAGAQVRRLDLLEDMALPPDAAGLVLAGTLWPDSIQEMSMNTSLLADITKRVTSGLPTLALGGGMLLMLGELQDTLGRTSEFSGVLPVRGEILWDMEEPAYVEMTAVRDSLLFAKGEKTIGWALSEIELSGSGQGWDPPLLLRGAGTSRDRRETFGTESLLCSPALVHMAATRGAATRFVERCLAFAEAVDGQPEGESSPEQ